MFLFGMILICSTLIYLLSTNNERNAMYLFGGASIVYFIFGYGVPLNEIPLLVSESNFLGLVMQVISIIIIFYIIRKFDNTIFPFDYNLVLRSFFFRFETISLALFLIGLLISSGNLIIDFVVMVAIVRLTNVDKFIAYVTVNAVLFTNAIFVYPNFNVGMFGDTLIASELVSTSNLLVAIFIPSVMLILYASGFLMRSLEKEIFVEVRIIGIIILTAVVGLLGVSSLSSSQMLIYLPIMSLILLSLNDMGVRKKFSRYSQIPLTLSIIIAITFILSIYISQYSFILFIICAVLVNATIMNERYQKKEQSYDEDPGQFKTIVIGVCLMFAMVIFANYSIYNATEMGVPYIEQAMITLESGSTNILTRTYELYANAAYFSMYTPMLIRPEFSATTIQFLLIAIPALSVISIPSQLLILSSTGYKTKISGEVSMGVIIIGLITLTLISYAIGA
ncbi:hypothetical protein RZE82_05905 [Mollicutes bacterium LVI A0039]|nr:hypothetical protein RZE82_05905 [Mollicutes bacterium LVI A0039]